IEIDSIVNTRGGAEKIRQQYKDTMWDPMIKAAAARAAAAGAATGSGVVEWTGTAKESA
ncbi:hypothetical protein HDU93_001217, partial [Gonapodya sp. JEL0774]